MLTRRFITVACLALGASLPAWTAAMPAAGGLADIAPPDAAYTWTVERDLQVAQRGCLSLNEAVQRVRRKYPNGRIIDAKTSGGTHIIKVLTGDGKVRTERIRAC